MRGKYDFHNVRLEKNENVEETRFSNLNNDSAITMAVDCTKQYLEQDPDRRDFQFSDVYLGNKGDSGYVDETFLSFYLGTVWQPENNRTYHIYGVHYFETLYGERRNIKQMLIQVNAKYGASDLANRSTWAHTLNKNDETEKRIAQKIEDLYDCFWDDFF